MWLFNARLPATIIKLLGESPAPAAVQCIANILDSPGGLKFFDGPAIVTRVTPTSRLRRNTAKSFGAPPQGH
jgi:hypothetical protein